MTNLKLIEYAANHFTVTGTFETMREISKKVEIDGEIYTASKREFINVCVEELNDFNICNLELPFLNLCYVVKDFPQYSRFSEHGLFRYGTNYQLSTDTYVAYWQALWYSKMLSPKIKGLFTSSSIRDWKRRDEYYDGDALVDLEIYKYGYGNSLYISISLEDFFSITNFDGVLNYEYLKNSFYKFAKINIDDKINLTSAIKLLNAKIQKK
jgi:hypothetical protein